MIIVNEINKNIYTVIIINKAMIINIFLFSIAIIYTTIKVDNKLDSMGELNNALEIKNNELRKIKHDYGAQISYLYGLYLLNRWDDFGKSLENIREKNKQVSNVVSIKNNENSIIYQALKPALDYGV
ncbi:MAG: histidine kinase, partial [Romboutsia sp.]|nr:histidine kinase [Romboutsia sp.]